MPDPTVAYFKGAFRPMSEARVSVRCKALQYGIGCFEGIRAYWNKERKQLFVFRLPEHFERLSQSCRILHMGPPISAQEMGDICIELLRRNEHREDTYIRPFVFNGDEALSPALPKEAAEFAMYTMPLRDYMETSKGISVCVSSWRRVADNMIPARAKPSAAYLNSALASFEAKSNGFDEAVFLTQDGCVSEGSAEHIFLVRDGRLVTPTSQEDNLDGITRRTIRDIAPDLGLEVVERRVSRTELYVAEEAFFCGTGVEIAPVVSVDHRPVGHGVIGPITRKVQELYFKTVRGDLPKYAHWCTPVYR